MDKFLDILKSAGFPYAMTISRKGKRRIRRFFCYLLRGAITFLRMESLLPDQRGAGGIIYGPEGFSCGEEDGGCAGCGRSFL